MKKRTLLFLILAATLEAHSEVPRNQYPKAAIKPSVNPWTVYEGDIPSSLPPELRKSLPKRPAQSAACRGDALACTSEEIYSTPNAEFRQVTKDTSDAPHSVGEPLSYASYLQKFMSKGFAAGRGNCAKGVRYILEAAGFIPRTVKPGMVPRPGIARLYYPYLRQFGFKHDWAACRRPGVVRIYGGAVLPKAARQRGYTAGDDAGHIEIVDLDGKFQSFFNTPTPAHEDKGEWRRPLLACMVKKDPAQLYNRGSR